MADNPYALDFFQQITDCHFGGGNWLYVTMDANSPSFVPDYIMRCDFIGSSGGSPGLLSNNGSVTGAINADFPYIITAADLQRKFITGAGLEVPGFGVSRYFPGINNPTSTVFFIRMDKFQEQFRVRLIRDIDPSYYSNVGVSIATVDAKKLKAGMAIPTDIEIVAGFAGMGLSASVDYIVNRSTMSITGPL